jgi:hypothetical protein
MSNACKGLAGLIFGHKFQPRYDKGTPALTSVKAADGCPDDWVDLVEASKPSTYIHDVCTRCGDIARGAK